MSSMYSRDVARLLAVVTSPWQEEVLALIHTGTPVEKTQYAFCLPLLMIEQYWLGLIKS